MLMRGAQVLAATAARLNHEAGAPPIPALYFFTDPERTPDPVAVAQRLPAGTAIVYRHFGAAERTATARRLAAIAKRRGLVLLIGADADLARRVGADGVHWPQRRLAELRQRSFAIETAATHDGDSIAIANRIGLSACVLSPVFPSESDSASAPLDLFRASALVRRSAIPVIALGGVNAKTARRLIGRGFAGIAAVDALAGA